MNLLIQALTAVIVVQAQPPAAQPGAVTLPLAEYNRLVEAAAKAGSLRPNEPPHASLIQSADLRLEAGLESSKDAVRGLIRLTGAVLSKGPARVELSNGFTILDARLQGSTAGLPLSLAKGIHSTILEGPTEFVIDLEAALPLSIQAGRATFTIPAISAGSVRVQITAPGGQSALSVSPGVFTSSDQTQDKTVATAILTPGKPAVVAWTARAPARQGPDAPVRETRFLSDIHTVVTASESEWSLTCLADVNVIQGEPGAFTVNAPPGYQVESVSGATLLGHEFRQGRLQLRVNDASSRSHQFLIVFTRSAPGEAKTEIRMPSFDGAQRETGEVLVEAAGAVELTTRESAPLRRMDQREVSEALLALSENQAQAAFRYQRRDPEATVLAIEAVRFPGAPLIPAYARNARVTSLFTREGRSITEVRLELGNRNQQYLRLNLPAGASIVSAEVSGEKVKPVEAPDGARVPLVRPGLRPGDGSYAVSFVLMQNGAPLSRRGEGSLTLPRMDLPLEMMDWEVYLPEEMQVARFTGDAVREELMPGTSSEVAGPMIRPLAAPISLLPGHIGGYIIDASGAGIPSAQVKLTHLDSGRVREVTTDSTGKWLAGSMAAGAIQIAASAPGFQSITVTVNHGVNEALPLTIELPVGTISESVEVRSDARETSRDAEKKRQEAARSPASLNTAANLQDLQRRVAGVLPVTVSIPRSGVSYRFARPLVVDEETRITFQYRMAK
jgi:hypothetical protein